MSGLPSVHLTADDLDAFLIDSPSQAAREHVAFCDACRSVVQADRVLVAALHGLPALAPADGFAERVMAQVRIAVPAPVVAPMPWPRRLLSHRRVLASAATAMGVWASAVWTASNSAQNFADQVVFFQPFHIAHVEFFGLGLEIRQGALEVIVQNQFDRRAFGRGWRLVRLALALVLVLRTLALAVLGGTAIALSVVLALRLWCAGLSRGWRRRVVAFVVALGLGLFTKQAFRIHAQLPGKNGAGICGEEMFIA